MFIINPKSLGLAGGILWGISLMVMTWFSIWTDYGSLFLSIITDIYPGYSISFLGSLIGLLWGFLDGFVSLFLLGWLYNFFEH